MEGGQPLVDHQPKPTAKEILMRGTTGSKLTTDWENFEPPAQSTYKGEPCIPFEETDYDLLAGRLPYTVVGKFSYGRPAMERLRREFLTIGFKGNSHLSLLDNRHVLIRFDLEEDYMRCWLKPSWYLGGFNMRMLKWSPLFRVDEEPSVVPVWISLPQLPVVLCNFKCLRSIGNTLGTFLKADEPTVNLLRPSVARICVEINLLDKLPTRIRLGKGEAGFWQDVDYEYIPEYCTKCKKIGHAAGECKPGAKTQPRLPFTRTNQANANNNWQWRKPSTNFSGMKGVDKDKEAELQRIKGKQQTENTTNTLRIENHGDQEIRSGSKGTDKDKEEEIQMNKGKQPAEGNINTLRIDNQGEMGIISKENAEGTSSDAEQQVDTQRNQNSKESDKTSYEQQGKQNAEENQSSTKENAEIIIPHGELQENEGGEEAPDYAENETEKENDKQKDQQGVNEKHGEKDGQNEDAEKETQKEGDQHMVTFQKEMFYEADDQLRPEEFLPGREPALEFHGTTAHTSDKQDGYGRDGDDNTVNKQGSPSRQLELNDDGVFQEVKRKGRSRKEYGSMSRSLVTRSKTPKSNIPL